MIWEEIEVEQWEIIKIMETEDITNPTIYILEYELSLDWFVPSDEMCVCSFRETTIEKITEMQMKEISPELIETNEELNSDEVEETQWIPWKAWLKEVTTHPQKYSYWCVEETQLLEKNSQFQMLLKQHCEN